MRFSWTFFGILLINTASVFGQAPAKRLLTGDDIYRFRQIRDPQVSPNKDWIAYTVISVDRDADKLLSTIWMSNWEGTQNLPLTSGPFSSTSPRWKPDGQYLAFLSARPAERDAQIWLLDRRGGEAVPLTDVKGEIDSFAWAPDGKRIVMAMKEREDKPKVPKPIVIDRFHFKQDVEGYLPSSQLKHLYLFEVDSKKLEALTADLSHEETHPIWSPDGSQIAFVSNHAADPDRTGTDDIFVVEARAGSKPRKLITTYSPDGQQQLAWSPNGKWIAFLKGFEPKYTAYSQDQAVVIPASGGTPVVLTAKLDRSVAQPEFARDSSALTFLVNDDRFVYLAKVALNAGSVERVIRNPPVVLERASVDDQTAVVAATDSSAAEIYAVAEGGLRKLTAHNDELLSELQLSQVEDISFKSKDGTEVHGMMLKPAGYTAGKRYPTVLWIHGGPNGQDRHSLEFSQYPLAMERQYFAAQGYAVLAINYRGSSGRGGEFARSIFADWGNKEVADLLAGVDYAVQTGIADADRLGIGGWSYGGILTDYTIASDIRFKAAISGAGSANQVSMYGSDQYILQYANELKAPWVNPDQWIKLSYPFFHADRIHTPTLFMGGEKDFNVPIGGSEQMYQALNALGVPTQLVVYPGQFHLFTQPSYVRDRLERYTTWFDKYLKGPQPIK
jgi:dipeptidyl aminopeptidase/acylaminoacyl peptidase